MRTIRVFSPATVANVGCGFDIFGFALEYPGDEIVLKTTKKKGVVITRITGDDGKLPFEPEKNTATIPILHFLEHLNYKTGFEIEIHKKMPPGSGLGSSAASAVAGVFGVNILLGEPVERSELMSFAIKGEEAVSGSVHYDNIGPALLGGFVIIRSSEPLDIIKINTPSSLFCTVVHPHVEIRTEYARSILKKEIPLADGIKQWGNVAGLVTGLLTSDYKLIGRSVEDFVAEPVRAELIPGYFSVKERALKEGALGVNVSGSGPSVFALADSKERAFSVGEVMKKAFNEKGLNCDLYVSKINDKGVKII
jgi:homoserine kinase